jgi:hypothetical protein
MTGKKLVFAAILFLVMLCIGVTQEKLASQVKSVCDGIEIESIVMDAKTGLSTDKRLEPDAYEVSSKMYNRGAKIRGAIIAIVGPAFKDFRDSTDTKNVFSFSCAEKNLNLTTSVIRDNRETSGRDTLWQPLVKIGLTSYTPKLNINVTWRLISGENPDIELHDAYSESNDRSKTFPLRIQKTINFTAN